MISTHVLDTARGKPAAGIPVTLEYADVQVGAGITNADGRFRFDNYTVIAGEYRITFQTGAYFGDQPSFYPSVTVDFLVHDAAAHYHVPLLLSPYGYSTYRGS